MLRLALLKTIILLVAAVCLSANVPFVAYDVFVGDESQRRKATADEAARVVRIGKCTGSLVGIEYVLTSAHCVARCKNPSRLFGHSVANKNFGRFFCESIVEIDGYRGGEGLDYAIVKIKWMLAFPPVDQKLIHELDYKMEVAVCSSNDSASEIYTVGFPSDKRSLGPIYAPGECKAYLSDAEPDERLRFNVGVFEGNSGGPLLLTGSNLLVGHVNGGRHSYRDPKGYNRDPENPEAWNFGSSIADIYINSSLLQKLFPEGKSLIVDDTGLVRRSGNHLVNRLGKIIGQDTSLKDLVWVDSHYLKWRVSFEHFPKQSHAENACADNWQLPSLKKLKAAAKDGLLDPNRNSRFGSVFEKFIDTIWIKEVDGIFYTTTRELNVIDTGFRQRNYVLCMREEIQEE